MQLKNLKYMVPALLAAAFLNSCSSDDVVQNGQENKNNSAPVGVLFEGGTEMPTSHMEGTATRTTATHAIGQGAKVFWEAGYDKVWVEDNGGTFRESSAATLPVVTNKANAMFTLAGSGSYTGTTHKVVYTGKGSTSATEVEIKANQTQSVTNSFDHLGASGDCGIATATKVGTNKYKFTLEHKAAYLAIYPRIQSYDALHKNIKISQIVITSTSGPIAGRYAFNATTGLGTSPVPTSGASNTITLNTTSGEIASTTRIDTCYYTVIAPGTHNLKVTYTLKDPTTGFSGTISKDLGTMVLAEGKITDVSAWLNKDIADYSIPTNPTTNPVGKLIPYYLWDAQQPFWYGHEWNKNGYVKGMDQPILNNEKGSAYPNSNTDPRYYNATDNGVGVRNDAQTALFKTLPNANEMSWYVMKGDPRWDEVRIWTAMGHLYTGGIWLKKKSVLMAEGNYNATVSADGVTDIRIVNKSYINTPSNISSNPISAVDAGKYFFLPALGYYRSVVPGYSSQNGIKGGLGERIDYSSSSAAPSGVNFQHYSLSGERTSLGTYYWANRFDGWSVLPFE